MPRKKKLKPKKNTFMVVFKSSADSKRELGVSVEADSKEEALEKAFVEYEQVIGKPREEWNVTTEVLPCH